MMEQLLSSGVAPKAFGIALLFAGLMSTFTGTIAGTVGAVNTIYHAGIPSQQAKSYPGGFLRFACPRG